MIRPLLVLATVLVTMLGAVTGAGAAELLAPVLAQSPNIVRGQGLYLNLYKFIPVVVIYLLWTWTTDWVEHDTKELNNVKFALWNSVVFFSGVLGLILIFAIPIYPLSLALLLLAYFVPILVYSYVRNQTVPDDQKVLTPYHLGEVVNGLLLKLGMRPMFNKDVTMVDRAGPPITFVGKSPARPRRTPAGCIRPRNPGRSWPRRSWCMTRSCAAPPTSTSSLTPKSSRCGIGSTASCTPPSRSTGPPVMR